MGKIRSTFFVVYCIVLLAGQGTAQQFTTNIRHLNTEDGLSNRFVRAILQDRQGFIWVGTLNGLNRYDGYEFKVYNANNAGLYNEGIYSLFEDPDGMIWTTYLRIGQLNIFDPKTGKALDFQAYFGKEIPFPVEEINVITCNDGTKQFYLLLRDGSIYEYLGDKKFAFKYKANTSAPKEFVFLSISTPTQLCFQVNNQLYFFDNNWQLKKQLEVPAKYSLIYIDEAENLIFFQRNKENDESGDENQLYLWNKVDNKFKPIPYNTKIKGYKSTYSYLYINNQFNIKWSLNDKPKDGLFLHSSDTSIFFNERLFSTNAEKNYWENRLNTTFFDKQGLLWVGGENGLYLVNLQPNYFSTYLNRDENTSHSMRDMAMDVSENLYAISYVGLYKIDLKSGKYTKIEWPYDEVMGYSILLAADSSLWIGTEEHGILQYIPSENKFTQPQIQLNCNDKMKISRDARSVWVLFEDKINNRLLAGAFNGLWTIDKTTHCLQAYDKYNDFLSLKGSTVYSIHQQGDIIWVGSSTGLYKMHPKDGITDHYHKEAEGHRRISHNTILFIQNAAADELWLGTKGGGLLKLNPKKGLLKEYSKTNGLSDNTIYAISPERQGYIWLSSNQGLMRFSIESERATIFLPEQGVPHEEFNTVSYFCAPDNSIFMGGLSGITAFHPDSFDREIIKPTLQTPFHITSFLQLDGKTGELLDKTAWLEQKSRIELAPQDKFFLLKFSLLDYANPKTIRYAYKIDGLNDDWIPIQENFIRIQGLASGQYTLHLKAQNSKGQWVSLKSSILIKVFPPFYKTIWFISLVSGLVILLFLGFYWGRIQNLKYIQKNLEQKIAERTRELASDKEIIVQQAEALRSLDIAKTHFFTNVSHELRTPLTLILGPIKAGLDEKYGPLTAPLRNALLNAHRNSLQLKRLVDELMDLAKLEDKKLEINEKSIILSLLLQSIVSPFQVQAALCRIELDYRYEMSPNLCVWIDVFKLEKIINNLLSNAFKFTDDGGRISFRIRQVDTAFMEISVSDTGSGIAANDLTHIFDRFFQSNNPEKQPQGGTGIGLALCKELTELMGGKIEVESTPGEGSSFRVSLPLKIADFDVNTIHFEEIDLEIPQLAFREATTDSPTLLIVEDNADMRLFLQEILSPHYHLILAQNGKDALAQLPLYKGQINLILSDVMMPVMDGFELLKELKSDGYWQQIPVILLTAKVEKSDKIKALRIGVDDYITKPFDSDELELRIRNLIQHYQQRQLPSEEENMDNAMQEALASETDDDHVFDNHWLQSVEEKALAGLKKSTYQFGIVQLAEAMLLSERQFRRRLKACTGLSPIEYLKELRLQWARELIESQQYQTVNEIVSAIGMSSATYFSNLYLARFGKRPSEMLQSFRK